MKKNTGTFLRKMTAFILTLAMGVFLVISVSAKDKTSFANMTSGVVIGDIYSSESSMQAIAQLLVEATKSDPDGFGKNPYLYWVRGGSPATNGFYDIYKIDNFITSGPDSNRTTRADAEISIYPKITRELNTLTGDIEVVVSQTQTLAAAKIAVTTALADEALKSNATTAQDIIDAAEAVITNDDITVAFSEEPGEGFAKIPPAVGTVGSIKGTLILSLGDATEEVEVNITIPALPDDGIQILGFEFYEDIEDPSSRLTPVENSIEVDGDPFDAAVQRFIEGDFYVITFDVAAEAEGSDDVKWIAKSKYEAKKAHDDETVKLEAETVDDCIDGIKAEITEVITKALTLSENAPLELLITAPDLENLNEKEAIEAAVQYILEENLNINLLDVDDLTITAAKETEGAPAGAPANAEETPAKVKWIITISGSISGVGFEVKIDIWVEFNEEEPVDPDETATVSSIILIDEDEDEIEYDSVKITYGDDDEELEAEEGDGDETFYVFELGVKYTFEFTVDAGDDDDDDETATYTVVWTATEDDIDDGVLTLTYIEE